MNSGIVILRDGTPCLVYDADLPHVRYAEYCPKDHLISLVWLDPETQEKAYKQLEYPVPDDLYRLLDDRRFMAVGQVRGKELFDLHMIPIQIDAVTHTSSFI